MPLRLLFAALSLGILLSGSTTPVTAQVTFETYEIMTDSTERQTIVTGFLLGGAMAELAVVKIDEHGERRARIYAFSDGTWEPALDATLGPEVLFVDVATIGGRDRLITYQPGRLNWFDPESATERALAQVTSNFNPPRDGEIPHVDVTQDVNDDDRADLVVPDADGFWVVIQMNDGAFADPVKIGPSTEMARIYGADGYRYEPWGQSRVHKVDFNQDGRSDLVFWNQDHFEVHTQDERGLFSPVGTTFTTEVAFDSDQLSSLASGDMHGKVLHSVTDMNGDGAADLVAFSLEGERPSRKQSTYDVHLGALRDDGSIAFAPDADVVLTSKDSVQLAMDRHDFDRDGHVDLMVTTIETKFLEGSLWKKIKGLMGDDVWLDLEFYRNEGGVYPDTPNAVRKIALDGAPSHREPGWVPLDIVLQGGKHERRSTLENHVRAFNRTLLVGDVTGDGLSDLLIESTPHELHVYAGVAGPDLFTEEPQRIAIAVPNDEEYTWLFDLNKDGKQDLLLMHHPFTERDGHGAPTQQPGTEPHRVAVLIGL